MWTGARVHSGSSGSGGSTAWVCPWVPLLTVVWEDSLQLPHPVVKLYSLPNQPSTVSNNVILGYKLFFHELAQFLTSLNE